MEQQWLEVFLGGDQQAFEELVLLYRKPAVLFALRLTHDLSAAEDAVQEAFAWLLMYRHRIRAEKGLKPLLYTLVRRRCMDWFRLWRRWAPLEERAEAAEYAADAAFAQEAKRTLHEALSALRPEDARVIHLLDIEGFTQAEAAAILGRSVGAVKVAHHRAKERLKERLSKERLGKEESRP